MNADGSGARRLTAGRAPQWTPSGQTIVFMRGGEIRTIAADGTGERRLAIGLDPTLSPDGRQVAFARDASVYAIGIEGGGQRLLYQFQLNRACRPALSDPAWSPGGRRIAFTVDYDGDTDDVACADLASGIIHVLDLHDGTRRSISAGVGLRWSPDGTQLLVDEANIIVMRADGTERRKLAGANASNPAWSPDGRSVAYDRVVGNETAETDVWIIGANGSGARRITTGAASSSPMWFP